MKRFIVGALAVIGALSILAVLGLGVVALLVGTSGPKMPSRVILELDLDGGLTEHVSDDPLDALVHDQGPTVLQFVSALEAAADDRRVVGLVARIGSARMGLARIQEVRDAVLRFRESGKPAIAWSDTFGEMAPGNGGYYLATAFDEILLQPAGDVGLTGLHYEVPFLAGTFEKLDVEPQIDHRHEYKNLKNVYTETGFTPAHREAMQSLMRSQFDQIVRGIADARGMTPDRVRELADGGPYLAHEALELGLVDRLAYRDEAYDPLLAEHPRAERLYARRYVELGGGAYGKGERIALIYGVGGIIRGESGYDAFSGERFLGADTLAAAFRQAIDDRRVRAIVFRIDCPGGSYVASDTVWRETLRARDAGKPVVVSMGDVAGSGGYFVAIDADRIVAQPGTITASIGVLGGKLVSRGLWNKLGVTFDEVHSSANARIWSPNWRYGESEYERLQAWLDRVYEDFTSRVSEGRDIPLERVLEIARGRVWTGEDALERELVDELGGFPAAIAAAKELAGIDAGRAVRLVPFPRPKSMWDRLFGDPARNSDDVDIAGIRRTLLELQPVVRMAREAGLIGPYREAPLSMPRTPPPLD